MVIHLSPLGWFFAICSLGKLIFDFVAASYIIFKAKKHNIRLLYYMAILFYLPGLNHLGTVIDFFTILSLGHNMDNTFGIHGLLTYFWFGFFALFAVILAANLINTRYKRVVIYAILLICVIYTIMLFLSFLLSFEYVIVYNLGTGEELINSRLKLWTPIFILLSILIGFTIIFGGGGLIKKGIQSTGIIRRKYFYIVSACFLYCSGISIESLFYPSYIFIFTRICISLSPFFLYFGVVEFSVGPKKKKPKKEITVQNGIFRVYKRPDYISEEDIIFHKEQKICLVCKSKVSKLLYVCPKCDVLYCLKCYNALSNAENACWVCNTVFDESKLSKTFKIELENEKKIIKSKSLENKRDNLNNKV